MDTSVQFAIDIYLTFKTSGKPDLREIRDDNIVVNEYRTNSLQRHPIRYKESYILENVEYNNTTTERLGRRLIMGAGR